ncbi:MAG: DUF4388 domain-containing protein [Myxococcales bacterium]|nr:DUF4388 domain-containing protein [Myxococcales bacterium]
MKDARAELVRIDASGVAHPIGITASQRMRAREGAFRLLPSPRHVVLMRLTGEDGKRDREDGAIVRLAGEITASGEVTDVLAMVAQANWRGELVVLDAEHTRSILFEQGNIVGVQTTCDDERLGSVLYRYGAITAEQRQTIVDKMKGGARFGEAASQAGLVSSEKLYNYMGKQIEEVVFATLTVSDGTFFFLDGFDAARLMSQHMVSAGALLMDAVTRIDEMNYFRQKIPTAQYVPVKLENTTQPPEELRETLGGVDGKSSVEEIGRKTGKGEFVTAKRLYALVQSKHVAIHPPRAEGGPVGLVSAANSALLVIHRYADQAGKGQALRESLASFAVGAGVYDILFRGAGPNGEGVLEPKAVADNSVLVAFGSDPENMLKQMLHEYVSFALFSAGTALGSEKENELKREVGAVLGKLRPQG